MALFDPKINSGALVTDYSWIQEGYVYGMADTGPFQRFKRSGRNSDIENWAAILIDAGWNVTVTRDRVNTNNTDSGFSKAGASYGLSTVEASAGWPYPFLYGTETPEDIWELDPQDDNIDLLSSDMPAGLIQPLDNNYSLITTKQAINDMVNGGLYIVWKDPGVAPGTAAVYPGSSTSQTWIFDGGANVVNASGTITGNVTHLPTSDYQTAKIFFFLLRAGTVQYPIRAPIIRHSLVTSSLYAVQASTNNVGKVISSSSMYTIEGVPNTLLFGVPTQPAPQEFIQTAGDLQYGWRKPDPAVSRLNRLKWRIQQNYIFGLFPIQLFGNPL